MKYPVFDFHCDTSDYLAKGKSLYENDLHIDLKRASKFPGYAQCFACYTTDFCDADPVLVLEKKLAAINRELERNSKYIRQAYTAEDIEANYCEGIMSAILTLEGSAGYGFDPELLEDLYLAGTRVASLCWNEKNVLTGSNQTGGGLTDLGRTFVKKAQKLGILIDVSHISDDGFWDIMDITDSPVIATHSNSRSLCNHPRNITDEMFLQICNTGGIVGINLYAGFIGKAQTLDCLCDHIFHFLSLDPSGEHIALGGDLDGCDNLAIGFTGVECYANLAENLENRGLGEDIIKKIFWNNSIEVMKRAVRNHKK